MEMKNTITKTRSSVGEFKGRFEQKEKWIREREDKTTEITKSQGEKKNGEKETKPKEPMKHHEVDQKGTVGVPEGKKR